MGGAQLAVCGQGSRQSCLIAAARVWLLKLRQCLQRTCLGAGCHQRAENHAVAARPLSGDLDPLDLCVGLGGPRPIAPA